MKIPSISSKTTKRANLSKFILFRREEDLYWDQKLKNVKQDMKGEQNIELYSFSRKRTRNDGIFSHWDTCNECSKLSRLPQIKCPRQRKGVSHPRRNLWTRPLLLPTLFTWNASLAYLTQSRREPILYRFEHLLSSLCVCSRTILIREYQDFVTFRVKLTNPSGNLTRESYMIESLHHSIQTIRHLSTTQASSSSLFFFPSSIPLPSPPPPPLAPLHLSHSPLFEFSRKKNHKNSHRKNKEKEKKRKEKSIRREKQGQRREESKREN